MRFFEAVTEVRRRLGFVFPFFAEGDAEWLANKIVSENRAVFDRLAKQ
jgi:hypothetical protein